MGYIAGIAGAAIALPILAQVSGDWVTALLNAGPLGAVLLWFMVRMEKRMTEQTKALDRFSETLLLMVTTPVQRCPLNENLPAVKKANDLLNEPRQPPR